MRLTPAPGYRLLVLDPDFETVREVFRTLDGAGVNIRVCEQPDQIIRIFDEYEPHLCLIILPRRQPRVGLAACRRLWQHRPGIHRRLSVILPAADEQLEIDAYEAGACYVTWRPLRPRALQGRLLAQLRSGHEQATDQILLELGPLLLDRSTYTVRQGGQVIVLPRKEFEILFRLAQTPGRLLTREQLLLDIWGAEVELSSRVVDVHVCNLRDKLGARLIATFKGKGYRLVPPSQQEVPTLPEPCPPPADFAASQVVVG